MSVLLTDFGLARSTVTGSRYTRTGQALGTPAYMSPEQARGERELTPVTDVWALGAILYELLAGRPAFDATETAAVIGQILTTSPPALRRIRPDLPAGLGVVCAAALQRSPHARPRTAAALRDDLDRVLAGRPPLSRAPRRAARAALALAILGAVGGAALWAWPARASRPAVRPADAASAEAATLADEAWALRLADPPRAIATMRRAVAGAPGSHAHRLRLGLLLWSADDVSGAVATWGEVPAGAADATRADWLIGLASLAAAMGEADAGRAAEAPWRRAEGGRGPEARWAAAGRRLRQGEPLAVAEALAGETNWEPTLLRALAISAAESIGAGDRSDAEARAYTQVLEDGLPLWVAIHNRAFARRRLGDSAGFLTDLDASVARAPARPASWNDRASAYLAHGQALADAGNHAGAARAFAIARESCERALAIDPAHANALVNRANVREELGDEAGAAADLEAALAADPQHPDARYNRGLRREREGDLAGARADFDAVLAREPRNGSACAHRGAVRARAGDTAGGLADLDAGIAADPTRAGSWRLRALARRELGDVTGALADLDAALTRRPDWPEALGDRALLREEAGDLTGAERDLTAALDAQPKHLVARFHRGRLRARIAEAAIEAAAAARPGTPPDARAVLADGIADLEQCLRDAPADWDARDHVARLLERLRARAGELR